MSAMKDSGVAWIGEIPEGWNIIRIKQLATEDGTEITDGDWIESPYIQSEGIRYFTTGNIGDGIFKEQGRSYVSKKTFEELGCTRIIGGDLIFSRLNLPIGRACILPEKYQDAVIAVDNVLLRPDKIHNKRFIVYITMCSGYQEMNALVARGTTMQRMSRTQLQNVFIPCPPSSEQTAIANYLDKKCASIDAAIEKEQKVIKKLTEYKQSVITEAVTKGLNPNVPMKDSGIEWIGEIPEGWTMVRLKFLMKEIVDCPHETPNYALDGEYFVIRTSDQDLGRLKPDEQMYRLNRSEYEKRIRRLSVDKGDIVYGREGSWGLACLIKESSKYCLGQRMMQFRTDSNILLPEFGIWALNSKNTYLQGAIDTLGSTAPHVNISTVINYNLPIPPIQEQTAIADYLDKKCAAIDSVITQKQLLIDKLTEYKKSLIYEMVTGKKEVPLC